MITLVTGSNSFAIREFLDKLKREYKENNSSEGVTQVDAMDIEPGELSSLIGNASLFSQKSLSILKNIDDSKEIAEALPDWLEKVPDDTHLVLVAAKPDKRTRWYKSAIKQGQNKQLDELNEAQLTNWVIEFAGGLSASISRTDASHLVSRVGTNQSLISNELQKLAAYDSTITKESINLLVDKTLEENVFELIDSVVKGRSKRAQAMYGRLAKSEIDPYKFIGLLAWQLHNLLVVKSNSTMPANQLASKAGMAPFVVNKTKRIVENLSLGQIKQMIECTLKTDMSIKQTKADSSARIRLLIDEISLITS